MFAWQRHRTREGSVWGGGHSRTGPGSGSRHRRGRWRRPQKSPCRSVMRRNREVYSQELPFGSYSGPIQVPFGSHLSSHAGSHSGPIQAPIGVPIHLPLGFPFRLPFGSHSGSIQLPLGLSFRSHLAPTGALIQLPLGLPFRLPYGSHSGPIGTPIVLSCSRSPSLAPTAPPQHLSPPRSLHVLHEVLEEPHVGRQARPLVVCRMWG